MNLKLTITKQFLRRNFDSAILMVEDEAGKYEPVEIVSSFTEAQHFVDEHLSNATPENDDLCPSKYALFVRNGKGKFEMVAFWNV